MRKKIIIGTVIYILISIFVYLLTCFVGLQMNPLLWTYEIRYAFSAFLVLLLLADVVFVMD